MNKEEKIKEAYGSNYDRFKNVIDEYGWNQKRIFNYQDLDYENFDYKETGHGIYISRPKSLRGIENNNGWIKIESKEQLLKLYSENEGLNMFFVINKKGYMSIDSLGKVRANRWFSSYTHYKIIINPQPPIY